MAKHLLLLSLPHWEDLSMVGHSICITRRDVSSYQILGYNQGMFAQVLTMTSFINRTQGYAATTGIGQGLLTSILELGAWVSANQELLKMSY